MGNQNTGPQSYQQPTYQQAQQQQQQQQQQQPQQNNYGSPQKQEQKQSSYGGSQNSYGSGPSASVAATMTGGSGTDELIDFGDRVVVSYNFWKDNVDMLERSKQQQLGILLFANLFKKQPLCRQLFADSDISKQSLRLLDMFGWLLRSMVKEKNQMRVRTLKSLGDRHVKYGIKIEFFRPMLDSLSDALQEYFGNVYNSSTRIALTTLFQSACNEMMKQAGQRAPFARAELAAAAQGGDNQYGGMKSFRWLRSLDHCLADPMGLGALAEFLTSTYCGELTQFHEAYRIYRCCLAPKVRKEIAHELCKLFLTTQGAYELNDSGDNRKKIFGIMQKCDELQLDYPIDLFDETHVWVKFQISQNAWMKFKIMIQSTT